MCYFAAIERLLNAPLPVDEEGRLTPPTLSLSPQAHQVWVNYHDEVERQSGEEGKCFKILCAKNAFHGRTFGGMSATPQEKIQKGFRPLVPGFAFGELNNLQSFADLIDEQMAAIFLETVQGEGGVVPCTDEFLWGVRKLCE